MKKTWMGVAMGIAALGCGGGNSSKATERVPAAESALSTSCDAAPAGSGARDA